MITMFVKKLSFRKLCVWAEKVTRSNVIETNVISEKVIAILSLQRRLDSNPQPGNTEQVLIRYLCLNRGSISVVLPLVKPFRNYLQT